MDLKRKKVEKTKPRPKPRFKSRPKPVQDWIPEKPKDKFNWAKLVVGGPLAIKDLPTDNKPAAPLVTTQEYVVSHEKHLVATKLKVATKLSSVEERRNYEKAARTVLAHKRMENQALGKKEVVNLSPRALWTQYIAEMSRFRVLERVNSDYSRTVVDEEALDRVINSIDMLYPYVAAMVMHTEGVMHWIEEGRADFLIADLDISCVPGCITNIESTYLLSTEISREL